MGRKGEKVGRVRIMDTDKSVLAKAETKWNPAEGNDTESINHSAS